MTEAFDLIWQRFPERQNKYSTAWWFFLLTPEQSEGYGPEQIMFAITSRAGDTMSINGVTHKGLTHPPRPVSGPVEEIHTEVVGWMSQNGRLLYHDNWNYTTVSQLDSRGSITSWDGDRGCEIRALLDSDKPFAMHARFGGHGGGGEFVAWGDPAAELTRPHVSMDKKTAVGDGHVVAYQKLFFEGDFTYPDGKRHLKGIGYFQRVCLNIPMFPWKWIWLPFADGSIFASFEPYIGLNVARRRDWFWPNALERPRFGINPDAIFAWGDDHKMHYLDKVAVLPNVTRNGLQLDVNCTSANGDYLRYSGVPYAHNNYKMDRPMLGKLLSSRFNYNEFLFKVVDLEGQVAGRRLTTADVGQGFGNWEYTWGLSL